MSFSVGKVVSAGAMGLIFGIALQKGRVFEPMIIRNQMLFSSFVMVKMFLSAVVTGQVALALLSLVAPAATKRAKVAYDGCMVTKSVASAGIGGMLLGAGMTLAGACPGMVLVQVGTAVPNSLVTLAGCFAGVLAYSMCERQILASISRAAGPYRLDEKFKLPFQGVALGLAAGMAGLIYLIESLRPWQSEIPNVSFGGEGMEAQAWSPEFSGMIVGLLQIPAVLILDDTLGSATSYVTLCAQWLRVAPGLESATGNLKNFKSGFGNWWQVFYVAAAIAGSALSASLARGPAPVVVGVSSTMAFLGGILMIFGSRLAGGCTSGHGLSGMAVLANMSFVAVPAMFAGGMGTAFALRSIGAI